MPAPIIEGSSTHGYPTNQEFCHDMMTVIFDKQLFITSFLNPQPVMMLHLTEEQLIGVNVNDLENIVDKPNRLAAAMIARNVRKAAKVNRYVHFEYDTVREGEPTIYSICIAKHIGDEIHVKVFEAIEDDIKDAFESGAILYADQHLDEARAIERKNKALTAVFTNLPIGVCVYDDKGFLTLANHSFLEIFGIQNCDYDDNPLNIFEDPNYPQDYREMLDAGDVVEVFIDYDFNLSSERGYINSTYKNGKTFHSKGVKITSNDGTKIGYAEIVEDITERSAKEQQVAAMQDDLTLSLSAGRLSVWKYDVEQEVFINVWGNSISKDISTLAGLEEVVHPNDFKEFKHLLYEIVSGLRHRAIITIRFNLGEGGCRFFECQMETRDNLEGKPSFIIGTEHEITDKVKLATQFNDVQKSLDLVMEAANVISWEYDIAEDTYSILYGSRFLEKYPNIKNHRNYLHPEDRDEYLELYKQVINGDLIQADKTIRVMQPDGKYSFFETSFIAIKDDDDKVSTLIGSMYDISKHLEKDKEMHNMFGFINLAIHFGNMNTWIFDTERRVFNVQFGRAFMNGDVTYDNYFKYMSEEYVPDVKKAIDTAILGEKEVVTCLFDLKPAQGQPRSFCQSFARGIKENGKVVYLLGITHNITELMQQKEAIDNGKMELNLALEAGDISAWVYDVDTKVFSSLYGTTMFGKSMTVEEACKLFHPDDVDNQMQIIKDLVAEKISKAEYLLRCKDETVDGAYVYYESHVISKKINDRVVKLIGTQRDVTTSYLSNEKLEEFVAKTNLIYSACKILPWDYDPYTHMLKIYPAEGVVSFIPGSNDNSSSKIIEHIHPEDKYIMDEVFARCDKLENLIISNTVRIRMSDIDDYSTISLDGIALKNSAGKIVKYAGIRRDESEKVSLNEKLKEAKLSLEIFNRFMSEIIDKIPGSVFVKDVNLRYVLANSTFCKFMKKELKDLIGKTDFEVNTDLDNDESYSRHYDADLALISEKNRNIAYEDPKNIDGEVIISQVNKSLVQMSDGRRYIIGISIDITQLKETNEQLEKARFKAEESDRLKSAFLANMSHEIRTPLNAIVGFSDLLLETEDPDERRKYCTIIAHNNELLLKLIGDILDLSKLESGAFVFNRVKFDLVPYFNELAASLKQRLINPDVEYIVENPYKTCFIVGDKDRVFQIISNFVTNAIKYTAKGFIKVGYRIEKQGVTLYTIDSGIGIPDDKKSKIFQRFEKLDSFAPGNGLGLYIVKILTELSGGHVGFESEEGKGSYFWSWRPFDEIGVDYNELVPADIDNGPANTNDIIKKLKDVLVAEDNDSNFLLITHLLKDYNLTRACNGIEAVEFAQKNEYDIILMDLKMPLMSGFEATERIRKFDISIPIIAVSAYAYDSDKAEALAVGCDAFVTKPIKKAELFEVMRKVIKG